MPPTTTIPSTCSLFRLHVGPVVVLHHRSSLLSHITAHTLRHVFSTPSAAHPSHIKPCQLVHRPVPPSTSRSPSKKYMSPMLRFSSTLTSLWLLLLLLRPLSSSHHDAPVSIFSRNSRRRLSLLHHYALPCRISRTVWKTVAPISSRCESARLHRSLYASERGSAGADKHQSLLLLSLPKGPSGG